MKPKTSFPPGRRSRGDTKWRRLPGRTGWAVLISQDDLDSLHERIYSLCQPGTPGHRGRTARTGAGVTINAADVRARFDCRNSGSSGALCGRTGCRGALRPPWWSSPLSACRVCSPRASGQQRGGLSTSPLRPARLRSAASIWSSLRRRPGRFLTSFARALRSSLLINISAIEI